jgi:hypothetical protein
MSASTACLKEFLDECLLIPKQLTSTAAGSKKWRRKSNRECCTEERFIKYSQLFKDGEIMYRQMKCSVQQNLKSNNGREMLAS